MAASFGVEKNMDVNKIDHDNGYSTMVIQQCNKLKSREIH